MDQGKLAEGRGKAWWGNGEAWRGKEKEKSAIPPDSYIQARTYTFTNEAKRFPGSSHHHNLQYVLLHLMLFVL